MSHETLQNQLTDSPSVQDTTLGDFLMKRVNIRSWTLLTSASLALVTVSGCLDDKGDGGGNTVIETGYLSCAPDPACSGSAVLCHEADEDTKCVDLPDACDGAATCECLGDLVCGNRECSDADGTQLSCAPATGNTCLPGAWYPSSDGCNECLCGADGVADNLGCTKIECLYDPCAGLECGAACSLCDPADPDCVETTEEKFCNADGQCSDITPVCEPAQTCEPGEVFDSPDGCNTCVCPDSGDAAMASCTEIACPQYDPCGGKECGAACTICDPSVPDCDETAEEKFCSAAGVCLGGPEPVCGPAQTCVPGEAFTAPDGCNGCVCPANGDASMATCTEIGCPPYDPCAGKSCGDACNPCDPADVDCAVPAIEYSCDADGMCGDAFGFVCPADPCEECLAGGGTWQVGVCTDNCDIADTWCFADACPGPCDSNSCGNCFTASDCEANSCEWNTQDEQSFCAAPLNQTCEPGTSFTAPDGCNACVCPASGDASMAICTEIACAPVYEPCGGKSCGASCTLCDPNDVDCAEDDVIKQCDNDGVCSSTSPQCVDVCEPGTGFTALDGCNGCVCPANGDASQANCTEMGCPPYDPCGGKSCGDACQLCDPADPDCVETDDIKTCSDSGICESGPSLCTPPYDPCGGKSCGDACQLCDPADADCVETDDIKACSADGTCESGPAVCNADPCEQCLASGGTWQVGVCTDNCDIADTWCYANECPGPCASDNCGDCFTPSDCESNGCQWNQQAEAIWCSQPF